MLDAVGVGDLFDLDEDLFRWFSRHEHVELARHIDRRLNELDRHLTHQIHRAVDTILAGSSPVPHPAVGFAVAIGGSDMDITFDVDVVNKRIVANWLDDKGDITPTPPNGPDGQPGSFSYASSDPTVSAVDASGSLTFLKAGSVVWTVSAVDSAGTPLPGFGDQPINATLTPGTATAFEVAVEDGPPVPIPDPGPGDGGPPPLPAPNPGDGGTTPAPLPGDGGTVPVPGDGGIPPVPSDGGIPPLPDGGGIPTP
jgi:hypothetical protein